MKRILTICLLLGALSSLSQSLQEIFTKGNDGFVSIPGRKVLWACTSAMDQYTDLREDEKGKASLIKIDLSSKSASQTYLVSGSHIFGDVITDKAGNPYISDGIANTIFTIQGDSLAPVFDGSSQLMNLQGLAFDKEETNIYISDYIKVLFRIDLKSKNLTPIKVSCDCTMKGIDGLYFYEGNLIAMHNGINPNRVMIYKLDEDRIISSTTVARGGEDLNEPTQGVIVNDEFFFIGNSPWTSYNSEGIFNHPDSKTKIFRYKLP